MANTSILGKFHYYYSWFSSLLNLLQHTTYFPFGSMYSCPTLQSVAMADLKSFELGPSIGPIVAFTAQQWCSVLSAPNFISMSFRVQHPGHRHFSQEQCDITLPAEVRRYRFHYLLSLLGARPTSWSIADLKNTQQSEAQLRRQSSYILCSPRT
jgi:hypothetical protein